jgi:hypothetical protein
VLSYRSVLVLCHKEVENLCKLYDDSLVDKYDLEGAWSWLHNIFQNYESQIMDRLLDERASLSNQEKSIPILKNLNQEHKLSKANKIAEEINTRIVNQYGLHTSNVSSGQLNSEFPPQNKGAQHLNEIPGIPTLEPEATNENILTPDLRTRLQKSRNSKSCSTLVCPQDDIKMSFPWFFDFSSPICSANTTPSLEVLSSVVSSSPDASSKMTLKSRYQKEFDKDVEIVRHKLKELVMKIISILPQRVRRSFSSPLILVDSARESRSNLKIIPEQEI